MGIREDLLSSAWYRDMQQEDELKRKKREREFAKLGVRVHGVIRIGINAGDTWYERASDGRLLCWCSDPESDNCPSDVGCHMPMSLSRIRELYG